MKPDTSPLHALAAALGVSTKFRDTLGNAHQASDETVRSLLRATGTPSDSDTDMRDALTALKANPVRDIPVARSGVLDLPLQMPAEWQIALEDSTILDGRSNGALQFTDLPIGLHDLTISTAQGTWTTPLPSAPARAPSTDLLTGKKRHWGVAAPVYGLPGPCRLGTYTALGELSAGFGRMGAAYTLINPVHALFPSAPEAYSPYSPSHRGFFNTAHIDPTAVPEFATSPDARAFIESSRSPPQGSGLLDYDAAAKALHPALDALFQTFDVLPPGHPRQQAFVAWQEGRGAALTRYAAYEALAEQYGPFWTSWPGHLRDPANLPRDRNLTAAARKHAYFQWLAETQLADAQAKARTGGMALGLMLDLAVGVRADGAETWAEPGNVAHGVSIGAPPDQFNPKGQNWALAPLNPRSMHGRGLHAFAETLRASMRHAGALRIDHVLGLRRNFWIANNTGEGAYIRFPQKALFAILAIEATRNHCLVVGEDLGNVPAGFREEMADGGLYGCRLLYFHRTKSGGFTDPRDYEPATVASIGSHDLTTLREWWDGTDLEEMETMGVLTGEAHANACAQRKADRRHLCTLLGLEETPKIETLSTAVHSHLAQSGSDLVTLQLEMLLPTGVRLNLPGTVTEYPNWRRKLPGVEETLGERAVREVSASVREIRK